MQQFPLLFDIQFPYNNLQVPNLRSVKGEDIMREEYIKEIVTLLEKCKDIPTLDLIHQILIKKCQNA